VSGDIQVKMSEERYHGLTKWRIKMAKTEERPKAQGAEEFEVAMAGQSA